MLIPKGRALGCKGLEAVEVGLLISYHMRRAAEFPNFDPDEYITVFTSYFHWPKVGQDLKKIHLSDHIRSGLG